MDDRDSWIVSWGKFLKDMLSPFHAVECCFEKDMLPSSDITFLLGCTKILSETHLQKSRLNIIIHESDLPSGRGWSPLSWQVLEGKKQIPIVLFEAREELDAGPIYLRDVIELDGTELLPELKNKQGAKTVELVCRFLEQWPDVTPDEQTGIPTFYPKRTRQDDQLELSKTLAEHFDHLRIMDNERYPAWFEHRGRTYLLKIYAVDETPREPTI